MRIGALILAGGLALWPATAPAYCKLALAFALDISSSVSDDEYRLQIDGLASALETEEVMDAILFPEGAWISAAAYEWSGYTQQDMLVGWSTLDSRHAVRAFATRLRSHRRFYADFPTAIGKAVEFGADLLGRSPPCARKVLDISGDGANNDGMDPDHFRALGMLDGLVINGLVIMGAVPDPALYYRQHVMQGPDAFVAQARDFRDYREVMMSKLLREINADMVVGQIQEQAR